MDAAQMLTAREMARHCEQIVQHVRQREQVPESTAKPRGRPLESVTQPLPRITEGIAGRDSEPPREGAHTRRSTVVEGSPVDNAPARDGALTPREWEILAFERQWWKYVGAKEQAIRELFDMSPTRYYQLLNALVERPEALRADPMLIKRLRRVRAKRQRVRNARRLGIELNR